MKAYIHAGQRRVVIPYRADLAQLVPGAVQLQVKGRDLLSLPHENDVVRVLRSCGFECDAPIRHYYDWSGDTPFKSQIVTSDMLTIEPRSYVLSEMGVGKTRAAIYAYDYLRWLGLADKMLIVAPKSTLNVVWENEVFANFSHLQTAVLYHPTKARRLKLLDTNADIYIINHDGMAVIQKELLARKDIDFVVIDELAVYANARGKRWKAARPVVAQAKYACGMTGSPQPNGPADTYGQIKLITPERLKAEGLEYYTAFRSKVSVKFGNFKYIPRQNSKETIHKLMQPAVRFTRKECFDLPPTTYSDRKVEMDPRAKAAYKKLLDDCRLQTQGGLVKAPNEGVKLMKLVQLSCGFVYDQNGQGQYFGGKERFQEILDIAEQAEGKLIIFAPFTYMVLALHKLLGRKYNTEIIYGKTSADKRTEVFNAFQRCVEPRIIAADPRTMAHGITLTAADTIAWFAPFASPQIYEQANARITRSGQTKHTHIIHVYASQAERVIFTRLKHKAQMQGALLELFETED